MRERPIVDGFTLSASMLYLPTSYRPSALRQMEVLRRASTYRNRQWAIPETLQQPIPAYSQLEYQLATQPGAYLWGLSFSAPAELNGELENAAGFIRVQITDACTETPLFSDPCMLASNLIPQTGPALRNPFLLPQPLLIGDPSKLDIELYNSADQDITCQLVLFLAEPSVPAQNIREALERAGVAKDMVV
jgi:hypothetical protein